MTLPDFPMKRLLTGGIHKHLILEAIILKQADELDLDDWENTVMLREASFARAQERETSTKLAATTTQEPITR